MTDTLHTPTYGELLSKIVELTDELSEAREANTRLRASADDNYTKGREWKDHADKLHTQIKELTQQVEAERRDANAAREEAAELRGYIRRVNELDPKRVRQQKHSGPDEIERVILGRY